MVGRNGACDPFLFVVVSILVGVRRVGRSIRGQSVFSQPMGKFADARALKLVAAARFWSAARPLKRGQNFSWNKRFVIGTLLELICAI